MYQQELYFFLVIVCVTVLFFRTPNAVSFQWVNEKESTSVGCLANWNSTEEIQFNKMFFSAIMALPFESNIRIYNQFSFSISRTWAIFQIKSLRLLFTTKANFFFFSLPAVVVVRVLFCASIADSVHRHFGWDCQTVCDFPCFVSMCWVNSHHSVCFHFCRKDKEQNVSIIRAFIYTIYGCFG